MEMSESRAVVCYRLPGAQQPVRWEMSADEVETLHSLERLNGRSGFVFAPFREEGEWPLLLFPEEKGEEKADLSGSWPIYDHPHPSANSGMWPFDTFSEALKRGGYDKLVLSRCEKYDMERHPDVRLLFEQAMSCYPDAFVAMVSAPQCGTWLMATPEVLLQRNDTHYLTIALAGTKPSADESMPWSKKDQREQGYVTTYLSHVIERIAREKNIHGPYTVKAGTICHLRTDLLFSLADDNHLGTILQRLHPTPAVCGVPKRRAFHFILREEGYDRRYYSGFVGRIGPAPHPTSLFVTLRCIEIAHDSVWCYAGGGLLKESQCEREWQETVEKMKTMKLLLMKQ